MNFFSEVTGRAVLIRDVGFPLTIRPQGWPGAASMKAVLIGLGLSGQGNYQFMQTLRNFVHVYVFGEKMGELIINGVAFAGLCRQGVAPSPDLTGLELVWKYYNTRRISQRGAPISIAIGVGLSFQGWLTAVKLDVTDPATGLTPFAMRFNFFPGVLVLNPDGTTTISDPAIGGDGPDGKGDDGIGGGGGGDFEDPLNPVPPLDNPLPFIPDTFLPVPPLDAPILGF